MRTFETMTMEQYRSYEKKIKNFIFDAFKKYNEDGDTFAMQAAMYGALEMAPNWYTIEDDENLGEYKLCKLVYTDMESWHSDWIDSVKDFIEHPEKWNEDCRWTVTGSNTFLIFFVSEDVLWDWD